MVRHHAHTQETNGFKSTEKGISGTGDPRHPDGTPDMTPAKKNHFHGNIGLSQRIMDELKMMNHALIVMA